MNRSDIARNLAAGIALVLAGAMARAADDLPKAETILDKYVEVTGGKAAYEKRHSEITKGTIEIPVAGLKGTVTSYRVEPDKSYSEVELGALGKMRDGSDGKVFWSLSSMMGPHVKDGGEKAQAILTERLNAEIHWRDLYKEVKTAGVEAVDGKDCYKVVLTPADGPAITEWYDKQSGLMLKTALTAQGPTGDLAMEFLAADYRKEGDILVPHKMTQNVAGQQLTFTIESVTFNAAIPPRGIDLPDEIKALVNKK